MFLMYWNTHYSRDPRSGHILFKKAFWEGPNILLHYQVSKAHLSFTNKSWLPSHEWVTSLLICQCISWLEEMTSNRARGLLSKWRENLRLMGECVTLNQVGSLRLITAEVNVQKTCSSGACASFSAQHTCIIEIKSKLFECSVWSLSGNSHAVKIFKDMKYYSSNGSKPDEYLKKNLMKTTSRKFNLETL